MYLTKHPKRIVWRQNKYESNTIVTIMLNRKQIKKYTPEVVFCLPVGLQNVNDANVKEQPLSLGVACWDASHSAGGIREQR